MTISTIITVNSRWWGEHIQCEVVVTRINDCSIWYASIDGAYAGQVPQWKFLDLFQPVPPLRMKKR